MHASVILAHPYRKSFNHALYARALQIMSQLGVAAWAHDLYEEHFDPVMTEAELGKAPPRDALVIQYARELMASDLLVFIHPDWWGMPPAILKGYIDRVIRPPYAYDYDESLPGAPAMGRLGGKRAIVFVTANTDAERERDYFGDPLEKIWLRSVFGFCGVEDAQLCMFRVVSTSTPSQRQAWLQEVEDRLRALVGNGKPISHEKD